MQREILFATNNAHKLEEVKAILGDGYRLVTLRERGITEEIPEEQPTIEGNALQKVGAVPTVSPTIPVWKLRRWAVRRVYTPRVTLRKAMTSKPT